ncbi:hypothetical protein B0H15DRAFT_1007320 [Mycena belliarum]|uniref:Uncharacterized protein n=1 Tax=Mycena belliarum TaxID=1033014 RepID=A0AAD6XFI9_9AGAR|nr:hypothetical protein B0H15DRAFT_1007320 [Mycena belliae]
MCTVTSQTPIVRPALSRIVRIASANPREARAPSRRYPRNQLQRRPPAVATSPPSRSRRAASSRRHRGGAFRAPAPSPPPSYASAPPPSHSRPRDAPSERATSMGHGVVVRMRAARRTARKRVEHAGAHTTCHQGRVASARPPVIAHRSDPVQRTQRRPRIRGRYACAAPCPDVAPAAAACIAGTDSRGRCRPRVLKSLPRRLSRAIADAARPAPLAATQPCDATAPAVVVWDVRLASWRPGSGIVRRDGDGARCPWVPVPVRDASASPRSAARLRPLLASPAPILAAVRRRPHPRSAARIRRPLVTWRVPTFLAIVDVARARKSLSLAPVCIPRRELNCGRARRCPLFASHVAGYGYHDPCATPPAHSLVSRRPKRQPRNISAGPERSAGARPARPALVLSSRKPPSPAPPRFEPPTPPPSKRALARVSPSSQSLRAASPATDPTMPVRAASAFPRPAAVFRPARASERSCPAAVSACPESLPDCVALVSPAANRRTRARVSAAAAAAAAAPFKLAAVRPSPRRKPPSPTPAPPPLHPNSYRAPAPLPPGLGPRAKSFERALAARVRPGPRIPAAEHDSRESSPAAAAGRAGSSESAQVKSRAARARPDCRDPRGGCWDAQIASRRVGSGGIFRERPCAEVASGIARASPRGTRAPARAAAADQMTRSSRPSPERAFRADTALR